MEQTFTFELRVNGELVATVAAKGYDFNEAQSRAWGGLTLGPLTATKLPNFVIEKPAELTR